MCVILILKPGVMPHKEALENAVWNNWHSYGLITKGPKTFDVIKKCPKDEVNPEEVWEILEQRKGMLRYLHLRHNTAGATSDENTHPFEVYRSKTNEIHFMHNGTLYEYKSKRQVPSKFQQGSFITEDDPDGPSDTKNFVDEVLIPYIGSVVNKRQQVGDLDNPVLQRLLRKYWTTNNSNRGILISKTQDHFLLGDWKTLKGKEGEFLASNDDYFEKVTRGPEKERRLLREEEEKRRSYVANLPAANTQRSFVPIEKLADLDLKAGLDQYQLSESAKNILGDYNVWDRETAACALFKLTKTELIDIAKDQDTAVHLMDWIFADYAQLFEEFEEEVRKRKKAEQYIIDLKQDLQGSRGYGSVG